MWIQSENEKEVERYLLLEIQELPASFLSDLIRWAQVHSGKVAHGIIKMVIQNEVLLRAGDYATSYSILSRLEARNFGMDFPTNSIIYELLSFDPHIFLYDASKLMADFRLQTFDYWLKIAHSNTDLRALSKIMQVDMKIIGISALFAAFAVKELDYLHPYVQQLKEFLQRLDLKTNETQVEITRVLANSMEESRWLTLFGHGDIHQEGKKPNLHFVSPNYISPLTMIQLGTEVDVDWFHFDRHYFDNSFITNMFRLYVAFPHLQTM
jgi:hypothetical protein